ncbi:hypothetical protein PR048_028579 [Dryococelus australis]|uniref:Uncharacterized protein n=1 Tax=Dryococelus australis TaxID=614101 RepID=A0ABQ9GAZ8_9NEOP|nr:hypothetical protein PR048_028579 [Dryococelus australis]
MYSAPEQVTILSTQAPSKHRAQSSYIVTSQNVTNVTVSTYPKRMSSDSTPGSSGTQQKQRRLPSTNASRVDSDDDDSDDTTLHDSDSSLGSLQPDGDNDDVTTPRSRRQFTEILRTPQTRPLAEIKCPGEAFISRTKRTEQARSDLQQRCSTPQTNVVFCGRREIEQNFEIIDLALSRKISCDELEFDPKWRGSIDLRPSAPTDVSRTCKTTLCEPPGEELGKPWFLRPMSSRCDRRGVQSQRASSGHRKPSRNMTQQPNLPNTCGTSHRQSAIGHVRTSKEPPRVPRGAAGSERLACSPPTWAIRVQSPAGSLPGLRMWESCRTMPLVRRFSRGSPVSPPFHSGAAPCSPQSPSSALKTSVLRAVQISSLTFRPGSPLPAPPPAYSLPPILAQPLLALHLFCMLIFSVLVGNSASYPSLRWFADYVVDLLFPSPLHSSASPFSPHFTFIGSQYPVVKSRQNLSTQLNNAHRYIPQNKVRTQKTRLGIEPGLPWSEASVLIAQSPRLQNGTDLRTYKYATSSHLQQRRASGTINAETARSILCFLILRSVSMVIRGLMRLEEMLHYVLMIIETFSDTPSSVNGGDVFLEQLLFTKVHVLE